MLIGIDASRTTATERTGTEAYAWHLIWALIALTTAVNRNKVNATYQLRLYFNQSPVDGLFPAAGHVEQVVIPWRRLWTHLRLAWELQRQPPDVFFTPAHVIPLTYRRRSVATVHDLGFHFFPEAHTKTQVAYLRWSTGHNGRRSRRVIADSQSTKADLARLYKLNPDKIDVVYPGLPPELKPVTDVARLTAVQEKYGIRPPYLLCVGTLQPRKNLVRLIEAYAASQVEQQLVLAGKIGWLAQPILDTIGNLPSSTAGKIVLPGFIADEDKAPLVSGATALLYPSLYEGFGFPVLEANACGTPVICANSSSLPEIAGNAALLVDPLDTAALKASIQRLVHDQELQQQLRKAGLANARRFTWEKAATQVLRTLEIAATL